MSELLGMEPLLRADQARTEALRCLQCFDPPCTAACPAGIVIPRFIRMLATGNVRGAAEVVRAANPLVSSCGVACPDEQLCGKACVRAAIDTPIEIRRLHRFASETGEGEGLTAAPPPPLARRAPRVAVIGAGPAGLACAWELKRAGVAVTVYEAEKKIGGVLTRTIPLYRFPEERIARDAAWSLGGSGTVKLRLGERVIHPEALVREYDAVFVAVGLSGVPPTWRGAALRGVVSADAFLELTRARRYYNPIGRQIAVIGGGNVAIDAALAAVRCAQVQGVAATVHLLYRRSRKDMPAWEREIALAERAGVLLHQLVAPERFVGARGALTGIELTRTRLVNDKAGTRPRPEPVPGSAFLFPCDQAIVATGQALGATLSAKLPRTADGFLRVSAATHEAADGIFAGGDATGGEQTIVAAVRDGKRAARAMLATFEGGVR